jgi:tRNA nucleotidyltransferase (CCA-adding enzyme)
MKRPVSSAEREGGPGTVDLRERLRRCPGGAELLALAPPGAFLVGGAVRDLLLDRHPRELDVVVEGEGAPFGRPAALLADGLAARLNDLTGAEGQGADGEGSGSAAEDPGRSGRSADEGQSGRSAGPARSGRSVVASEHERFGTATVEWAGGRIDVAAARRERYAVPGALPEVRGASLTEDLLRRDFTVNALALALDGERPGELQSAPHALEDLRAGRLRVLHERSFLDDPTRLWRLARYRARLGFAVEEHTAQLAAAAVAQGAPRTVSGARVGAELRLALAEPDPQAALAELDRLGLLGALHPRLRFEAPLADRALELLGAGEGRPDLLLLAALALPLALRADGGVGGHPTPEIAALLDRLEFTAAERDRAAAAAAAVPHLVEELPRAAAPSRLRALAVSVPPEGVALAGAVSAPAAPVARRWLEELRYVRLRIGGEDLLAAGIPQGPEIGRRLEETLRMRLDGELPDERDAQLRVALR